MSSNPYASPGAGGAKTGGVNGLGIAGFVVSIVGVLTCGTLSLISLPLSLIALAWKPRGMAIAGTVISLVGCGIFGLIGYGTVMGFLYVKQGVENFDRTVTNSVRLGEAERKIVEYQAKHNALPDPVTGNKLIVDIKDAWDTQLRYDVNNDKFVIRSAGPDKEFDNSDDVKSSEKMFELDDVKIETGDGAIDGPVVIPDIPSTTPEKNEAEKENE